jgi:uncharacterized protein (DUF362 family)
MAHDTKASGPPHKLSDKKPNKLALSEYGRREILFGGTLAAAACLGYPLIRQMSRDRAAVFIARRQRYNGDLVRTIRDGLLATGLDTGALRGKLVLLKPNLVEPTKTAPFVTTHPNVVAAAIEVFRHWGADVVVGEGPGHVRDTEMALGESNLQGVLDHLAVPFADLNYEEVEWVRNRGRACSLPGFFFPRTVVEADVIVSMPKMKTHHWVGVTASLKNMYGVIPGIKYGWPKNVLHHAGLSQTIFDINASLPKTISIVDGIECMEGDGPIMGTPKKMGVLVIGTNPAAVDATVCRLMRIDPTAIEYLYLAGDKLGPTNEDLIYQRGESWRPLASSFNLLNKPHLRGMRV